MPEPKQADEYDREERERVPELVADRGLERRGAWSARVGAPGTRSTITSAIAWISPTSRSPTITRVAAWSSGRRGTAGGGSSARVAGTRERGVGVMAESG